jgi:ribosomal protein S18 acetylase RimI-like enzyme
MWTGSLGEWWPLSRVDVSLTEETARLTLRNATTADIEAMALIRSREWGDSGYWQTRIAGYLDGSLSPQQALTSRHCLVAAEDTKLVGFVAGHLTRRHDCMGEVQWLNVALEWRRQGLASVLLRALARWFASQNALRVCVDVEPANSVARAFYQRHGARELNRHWLVWDDITVVHSAGVCE